MKNVKYLEYVECPAVEMLLPNLVPHFSDAQNDLRIIEPFISLNLTYNTDLQGPKKKQQFIIKVATTLSKDIDASKKDKLSSFFTLLSKNGKYKKIQDNLDSFNKEIREYIIDNFSVTLLETSQAWNSIVSLTISSTVTKAKNGNYKFKNRVRYFEPKKSRSTNSGNIVKSVYRIPLNPERSAGAAPPTNTEECKKFKQSALENELHVISSVLNEIVNHSISIFRKDSENNIPSKDMPERIKNEFFQNLTPQFFLWLAVECMRNKDPNSEESSPTTLIGRPRFYGHESCPLDDKDPYDLCTFIPWRSWGGRNGNLIANKINLVGVVATRANNTSAEEFPDDDLSRIPGHIYKVAGSFMNI